MKILNDKVYPSEETTIGVYEDNDVYGGAHYYKIKDCLGFNNGKTEYAPFDYGFIQFIKKLDDGTIIPGVQSEQLVIILIDRHKKLNSRFPSPQNEKMLLGLQMFLDACKERVDERIKNGVMGQLKN